MLVEHFPLERAGEAYHLLHDGKIQGRAVITPSAWARSAAPPTREESQLAPSRNESSKNAEITPFRIAATDSELDDLKHRLHNTRWSESEFVDDRSQGFPLAYAQEVYAHWEKDIEFHKNPLVAGSPVAANNISASDGVSFAIYFRSSCFEELAKRGSSM